MLSDYFDIYICFCYGCFKGWCKEICLKTQYWFEKIKAFSNKYNEELTLAGKIAILCLLIFYKSSLEEGMKLISNELVLLNENLLKIIEKYH